MNKGTKLFNTIFFSIMVVLFALSFSIALPILFRPFYYLHIDLLDIVGRTGVSKENLIYSYNDLMNYLCFFKEPFSIGVFPFSEEGMNHFIDCRYLFILDEVVLLISSLTLVIYFFLFKYKKIKIYHPFHMSLSFFIYLVPLTLFSVLGIYAIIDFWGAFSLFHSILFPGKSNWVFDPTTDPVIKALPEEFFMNAGILILLTFLLFFIGTIIYSCIRRSKYKGLKIYIGR